MTITAAEVSDGDTSPDATLSLTFTASENTTDFEEGDILVTNGALSGFAGSGSTYTATFTPAGEGACTINVLSSAFTDAAGIDNTAADEFNWTFDSPLKYYINASEDDVEEFVVGGDDPGELYFDSSDLELVNDFNQQIIGLRFANVDIPQGATVSSAYIQFTVDELDSEPTSLTISIENIDDAAEYVDELFNVSSRSYITETVEWSDLPAWTTVGASGEEQATPDLSALLQSIVNRFDWVSGNAVSFKIEGSGARTAESYDGQSALAPHLVVELAVAGCTNPDAFNYNPDATVEDNTCIF